MTAFTPGFLLPYPNGLDAPCDFSEQWCAFTDAVEARLSHFQAIVDRTVPAIPLARLQITTPVSIVTGETLVFDTLSVNTAAWVDFDANASSVTVDRGGRIYLAGDVTLATTTVAGTILSLTLPTTSGSKSDSQKDRGSGIYGLNVEGSVFSTAPVTHTLVVSGGSGTLTVNRATFTVWWHADTATP